MYHSVFSILLREAAAPKISNYIFVLTPRGINISGEFQEIITGTFDPEDVSDGEEDY